MLVLVSELSVVIGVRVGLGVPMAFGVSDRLHDLDEDLGGYHFLHRVSLVFGDLDIFLARDVDLDGVLLDLGDHDISLVLDHLGNLDGLRFGVALGHHNVKGDVLGHGDLAGDGHIVLLVHGDLNGNLDVRVLGGRLGGSRGAAALGVAAAAVPLALAATLLLEALALLFQLLDSRNGLVVHDGLVDGPPRLLGGGLGDVGRLLAGLLLADHAGLCHVSGNRLHDLFGLSDLGGNLDDPRRELRLLLHDRLLDRAGDGPGSDHGGLDHAVNELGHHLGAALILGVHVAVLVSVAFVNKHDCGCRDFAASSAGADGAARLLHHAGAKGTGGRGVLTVAAAATALGLAGALALARGVNGSGPHQGLVRLRRGHYGCGHDGFGHDGCGHLCVLGCRRKDVIQRRVGHR